jgi:zinc protease
MTGRERIERKNRPVAGPAPKIELAEFQRFRLGNGMAVLAIHHDDLPQISTRLVLPHGTVEDPRERAGTALLTARALTEGTRERSASAVAEWLDFLGARFSLEVTYDASVLSLHFLSRVFDQALDFLAEVVTDPAFDPREVERLRDERLVEIARGRDEPRVIAGLRLSEAMFGDHPYGMRTGGVEQTVREIGSDALRSCHTRYYRPRDATLVIVGDVPSSDELKKRLEEAFGAWTGEAVPPQSLGDPEPIDGRRLWAVQRAGPQSEIRVGVLGVARSDPDYAAISVMNAILGGLFSSRINMNLREEKGWTYGASSVLHAWKRRGPLSVSTAVDAEVTVAAVREILGEMERMKTNPASSEELELAINSLTLSLPRLFETPSQVSRRVKQQIIYDLPADYWETYADQVRATSEADVQRVANCLLDTEAATVVVVGPVDRFLSELEELGTVEVRDTHGRPSDLESVESQA